MVKMGWVESLIVKREYVIFGRPLLHVFFSRFFSPDRITHKSVPILDSAVNLLYSNNMQYPLRLKALHEHSQNEITSTNTALSTPM